MAQVTKCPKCSKNVQVPDGSAGKQLRCPFCKQAFVVPGAAVQARQAVGAGVGGGGGGPASVADEDFDLSAAGPTGKGGKCPACGADMNAGAVACMDCGWMAASGEEEAEDKPNLCTNPACGVANPPGERNCVRCSTPLPTASGTILHGRYRIDKQLAVGGFGAVYLSTDTKSNKQVAIKEMICPDPQEYSIRLNFFRREADILKMLDKVPIVPRVFDYFEKDKEQTAHLVLEFIRGQDLLKLMEAAENKPFPIPQIIEWAKSICDVLQHMHTQQPPLVHRDLKPDNIMLLEDQRSIKMIDFGTARDVGRTQKERLAAKTRVYTEGYAPPEQIIGKPEPRSDLFALAGTLYHLATGKAPEGFYTAKEIEQGLASGQYPAEHRWFFELIKINLAEDVNDRYFTAKEFKADLVAKRVTKEVACPKCKTSNKVREPYCKKCAAGLTDPIALCNHCGKNNRMGSRHCIYCGNRLR
jgi:predicted Ser/Thr protein kinase